MARYVVFDTEQQTYLLPRPGYWTRKELARANRGDDSKWTKDLQKARVFTNKSAAGNAYIADRWTRKVAEIREVFLSLSDKT